MDIAKRKIFTEVRMFKTQCAKLEIKGKLLKEKEKDNVDFKQKLKKKKKNETKTRCRFCFDSVH